MLEPRLLTFHLPLEGRNWPVERQLEHLEHQLMLCDRDLARDREWPPHRAQTLREANSLRYWVRELKNANAAHTAAEAPRA